MNKYKFVAELERLLGFMSSWDRQAVIDKYTSMLDEAEDANALIEELGSPTKLAIRLAGEYVPSAPPAAKESVTVPSEEPAEDVSALPEEATAAAVEEAPAAPVKRARPVPLAFYTLLSLLIGLPVAVLLIALGIPFLVAGVGIAIAAVWAVVTVIGMLSMFSDILLVLGAAAAVVAVGLLLTWLGLWISLSLGYIWIGRVIFGLGGRLCFKKEVAAE